MHRVLRIPELLDIIFSDLDTASNVSNTTVCKLWSEIALDTLWNDVKDLRRFFGLLAPIRQARDDTDEYVCDIHLS